MEITFNKQKQSIEAQTSLQSLLKEKLGERQNGIAVAINQTIVPKKRWATHALHPNDQVLVITATQGG
ncbi:sulfur carrier protein ThiS [Pedobacter punctiformis]|uniref:Sulfur carrier protein ThiS n=1 Tax=Pedobacter punctiformis TaxID=3004097 RepID=A0ABT4L7Q5_9SPHI|nr:sulfur carrier protein ThiS [Pedobacter sp. HCMS5-2]MCZ4243960.1 sulfur carrier protein ThiS [Pedobacter sp. HCMS5-2]